MKPADIHTKKPIKDRMGVIGLGTIGGMLAERGLHHNQIEPSRLFVYDHHAENIQKLTDRYPEVNVCGAEAEVCGNVDRLIVSIKPPGIPPLLASLRQMFAGQEKRLPELYITTSHYDDDQLAALWPKPCVVCLPTIAGVIDRGVVLAHHPAEMDSERVRLFEMFMRPQCHELRWVEWSDFPAPNNLTGCAPAFVAYMVQAMADATQLSWPNMRTDELVDLAKEALISTCMLLDHRGVSPLELISSVGSPGGITYTALSALEETFPASFGELVRRSVRRHHQADSEAALAVKQALADAVPEKTMPEGATPEDVT